MIDRSQSLPGVLRMHRAVIHALTQLPHSPTEQSDDGVNGLPEVVSAICIYSLASLLEQNMLSLSQSSGTTADTDTQIFLDILNEQITLILQKSPSAVLPLTPLSLYRSLILLDHFLNQIPACSRISSRSQITALLSQAHSLVESRSPLTQNRMEKFLIEDMQLAYSQELANGSVTFSSKVFFHGFEADIILTRQESHSGKIGTMTYNIEIDGPSHHLQSKKRFCLLRDRYLLEAHGVKVLRCMIDEGSLSRDDITQLSVKFLQSQSLLTNNK